MQRLESLLPIDSGTSNRDGVRSQSIRLQLSGWAIGLRDWLGGRFAKHRSRRALARLDGRLLDDVGITEKQRQRELSRGFWD